MQPVKDQWEVFGIPLVLPSAEVTHRGRLIAQAGLLSGFGASLIHHSGALYTRKLKALPLATAGAAVIVAASYFFMEDWRAVSAAKEQRTKLNKLKADLQKAKAQVQTKEKELGELQARLDEGDTQHKASKDALEQQVQESSTLASELQEEKAQLRADCERLNEELELARQGAEAAQNEKSLLREELEEAGAGAQELHLRVASLEEQLGAAKSEALQLGKDLQEVTSALQSQLRQARSEAVQTSEELQVRIASLEEQLRHAKFEAAQKGEELQLHIVNLEGELERNRKAASIFESLTEPVALVEHPADAQLQTPPKPDFQAHQLEIGENLLSIYNKSGLDEWKKNPLLSSAEAVSKAVAHCACLSGNGKGDETNVDRIRTFFEKLKDALPITDLNLAVGLSGKTALQRILSMRLDKLLAISNPNTEELLEIDLAKAELATRFNLGIVPTSKGKNGAVFIKTLEGKSVGVFKAKQELSWSNWTEIFKQWFGQARLLNLTDGAREYSEVVAADLAKCLGPNFSAMIPQAIVAKFCGQEGAFIEFKHHYEELCTVKHKLDNRKAYEKAELIMWQRAVLWFSLTTNLDANAENTFVQFLGETDLLAALCLIDHGNFMPVSRPGAMGAKGNLGVWGDYKISQQPFEQEVIEEILELITEEKITEFIEADPKRAAYFKQSMRDVLLENVRVLRECVAIKRTLKTPADLAVLKTDGQVKHALHAAAQVELKETVNK